VTGRRVHRCWLYILGVCRVAAAIRGSVDTF
jgi:hypothetical protein